MGGLALAGAGRVTVRSRAFTADFRSCDPRNFARSLDFPRFACTVVEEALPGASEVRFLGQGLPADRPRLGMDRLRAADTC